VVTPFAFPALLIGARADEALNQPHDAPLVSPRKRLHRAKHNLHRALAKLIILPGQVRPTSIPRSHKPDSENREPVQASVYRLRSAGVISVWIVPQLRGNLLDARSEQHAEFFQQIVDGLRLWEGPPGNPIAIGPFKGVHLWRYTLHHQTSKPAAPVGTHQPGIEPSQPAPLFPPPPTHAASAFFPSPAADMSFSPRSDIHIGTLAFDANAALSSRSAFPSKCWAWTRIMSAAFEISAASVLR